ncbi:MAG: Hsp20/alpha crystallin family protein [Chloroflexota bacterium]
MANLVRWEPLNDVVSLRDAMDHLFQDSFIHPRFVAPLRESIMGGLALDMIESANDLVVKASVPGYKPEDIDITVVGDLLTIKGEVKAETKEENEAYLLHERRFGTFKRMVELPVAVQADKAKADFENGVLTLILPKVEEIKPKQIKVTAKNGAK